MNQKLLDQAWFLACVQEGYQDSEVPDWVVQQVTTTQMEIYNQLQEAAE